MALDGPVYRLLISEFLSLLMPPKFSLVPGLKKQPKAARADDDDGENGLLEARTSALSTDRKRKKTTIPDGVARVATEHSRSYLSSLPVEERPDVVSPALAPKKPRRYKNSVSTTLPYLHA